MSETNNTPYTQESKTGGFFTKLYRARIRIAKGNVTILNLSALFSIIALLCAPWLVMIGAVVALILGYKFSISRNDGNFSEDWNNMVHRAAGNVKNVVDSIGTEHPPEIRQEEEGTQGQ